MKKFPKRQKLSKKQSKKSFKKGLKTKRINNKMPSGLTRGGTRM